MSSSEEEHDLDDLIDNEQWDDAIARAKTKEGREELRRKGRYGWLPLHWACRNGAPLELVKAMVEGYPESVRVADDNNYGLPLHWACSSDDVQLLLDAHPEGAKATDNGGRLPLHRAAYFKAPSEVLEMLIDAHPEGAATRDKSGSLPLHELALKASPDEKEDVDKVKVLIQPLLDNEEACRAAGPNGMLPLHIAAQFNLSCEILRTLRDNNNEAAWTPCRVLDEEGRWRDVYPLNLLEMRRPANGTTVEIAAFDEMCSILFTERGDVYAMGCTTDSPLGATDCLGYTVYAEALARAARMVESPFESLCVGMYGTWGCGKSVLWSLVSKQLDAMNLEEDVERFERWDKNSSQMKKALEALDSSDAVDPRVKDKCKGKEQDASKESHGRFWTVWIMTCFVIERLYGMAYCDRYDDQPKAGSDGGNGKQGEKMSPQMQSMQDRSRSSPYIDTQWKGNQKGSGGMYVPRRHEELAAGTETATHTSSNGTGDKDGEAKNDEEEPKAGSDGGNENNEEEPKAGSDGRNEYDEEEPKAGSDGGNENNEEEPKAGSDGRNEYDEEVALPNPSCRESRKDERIALIIVALSPILFLLLPFWGWLIFGCFSPEHAPSDDGRAARVWDIFMGRTPLGQGDAPFSQPELNEGGSVLHFEGMVRYFILVLSRWVVYACMTMQWLVVTSVHALGRSKSEIVPNGSGMYVKVIFNAWVYQGSDLLWASLIKKLWEEVESVFGKRQVHLHRWSIAVSGESSQDTLPEKILKRRVARYNFQMKSIGSSMLGLVGVILLTFFGVTYEDFLKNVAAKLFAYLGVLGPFSVQAYKWLLRWYQFMRQSQGQQLYDEAKKYERHDFKEETGFMGKVRDEVDYLFDFLRTTTFYDEKVRCHRKARLCIFVDDLDRCESKKIVSMLQAVKLLLDDAPVTCWLAIDSRNIVSSVEEEYKGVFANEGISGHEFLDKIVQLPFCLPDIDRESKLAYLKKITDAKTLSPINILDRLCRVKTIRGVIGLSKEAIDRAKEEKKGLEVLVDKAKMLLEKKKIEDTTTPLVGIGMTKAELITTMYSASNPNNVRSDLKNGFLFMLSEETSRLANAILTSNEAPSDIPPQDADNNANDDSGHAGQKQPHDGKPDAGKHPPIESSTTMPAIRDRTDPFVSMLDMNERKHLETYAEFIHGNARKMKRIVNIYNVTRYIFSRHRIPRESRYNNSNTCKALLLKFVILLEQWPYRMAWLLQIIEDARQVRNSEYRYGTHVTEAGQGLFDLLKELVRSPTNVNVTNAYKELSAGLVYRKIVQGLIYSPHNAVKFLARDADPQMFECLLNVEPEVKLIDLDTFLRPYAFNIQKSLMDTVARMFDECALVPKDMREEQKKLGSLLQPTQWLVYYQKKAALFGCEERVTL